MKQAINLSGIQKLPLEDWWFEDYTLHGQAMKAQVIHDEENKYQSKKEPALAVTLDGRMIGYIPVLSTIERYINQLAAKMGAAMASMDAPEHNRLTKIYDKQNQRHDATLKIRGWVETDLFINELEVFGVLSRVQIADDSGKVLSVSVMFQESGLVLGETDADCIYGDM
jgi:hypothetical protein